MGLPVHPQGPPRLSSLSQKGMAFLLNAGLVGNLCGLAVRKQKLIIHISRPEGAVVCRVDSFSGSQTQNSPGPWDKQKTARSLETAGLKAGMASGRPWATNSLLVRFVWAAVG